MKLWIFWVTLFYLAGHFGHCDIGFGHSDDVDDEPVRMQPVVPPPFKNDVKLEMTTVDSEKPILVGQAERVDHTNVVETLEFATVGNDGVADSSVVNEEENSTQITVGNQVDTAEEEILLQAPPSVSTPTIVGVDGSIESTHNQPISPADVSPESTPSNSEMKSMPTYTGTPEYDPAEVEDESKSFDGELSMVGAFTTEALLDQLDAAEAQVAALTARNAALDTSLTAATTAAAAASQEALELRFQVAVLTTSLGSLTEELNANANVTSEQHEQLYTQHALELHAAQEKFTACERNATTLAIRARLEKNEKNIARLSVENCRLTLESSSHLQLDERQELEAQIVALKKQLSEAKCSPASAAPSLASSVASTRKPPVSNAERVGISAGAGASESECDASQCLDRLLSKYVFFWAPEHQESKPSSTSSRSSTASSSPAANSSDATADSAASANIIATATASIDSAPTASKTKRPDAYLDHIGDADEANDSNMLLAVQVLQRAGSSVCTLYAHHVHPLVYTLLKSEFMVVAAVAKGVYDGVGLLWHAALSPFFYHTVLPTLQNVYYTQLMPFVHSTLYPWYRLNFEHTVNTTIDRASKYYTEHYEELIGYYILDPCEFLMGRLYYLQYFLMKFVQSEDLGEQMEQIGVYLANFVPSVITQLCSIPALQSHFGDSCVVVVSSVVYGTVALGVYLCRRVVLGVIAFVLVLLLSPLLFGVYLCAKVLGMLRPRKKTKRAAGNAPRSSHSSSNGGGNGGSRTMKGSTGRREGVSSSNVNSHAPLHSQPPQVSTKLPLNAAIASVAPTSHVLGGNNTASQLQPPPIVGNAAYSGQMYNQRSNGGNSSVSGPPQQGAYAYSNSTSSDLPARQTQRRSGSDESLNKHGAPPTGSGTGNVGETWLGV